MAAPARPRQLRSIAAEVGAKTAVLSASWLAAEWPRRSQRREKEARKLPEPSSRPNDGLSTLGSLVVSVAICWLVDD